MGTVPGGVSSTGKKCCYDGRQDLRYYCERLKRNYCSLDAIPSTLLTGIEDIRYSNCAKLLHQWQGFCNTEISTPQKGVLLNRSSGLWQDKPMPKLYFPPILIPAATPYQVIPQGKLHSVSNIWAIRDHRRSLGERVDPTASMIWGRADWPRYYSAGTVNTWWATSAYYPDMNCFLSDTKGKVQDTATTNP